MERRDGETLVAIIVIHVSMRDERRKEEKASKVKQTTI